MQRFAHVVSALGCANVLLVTVAAVLSAQVAPDQTAAVLERMRADFAERRYAAVIAGGNALLESARVISTPLRIEIWQLLAAAYYPDAPDAQQPDSAALPLAALIRLAPDITIARDIAWPGLDALTERTRAQTFAVVTRPQTEYSLSADVPGHLTVLASRRTRIRLMSVNEGSDRVVIHDSATFVGVTELQLRTHDAQGPIFTDGEHRMVVWAHDLGSGDSLHIVHRVQALRSDLPPPIAEPDKAAADALPVVPVAAAPATSPRAAPRRSAMLWGGLVLAAATAVLAQDARPDDALRSAFLVDARAFVISVTMAGATVANFFAHGSTPPPVAPTMAVLPLPPPPPPPVDTYRVRLHVDPLER